MSNCVVGVLFIWRSTVTIEICYHKYLQSQIPYRFFFPAFAVLVWNFLFMVSSVASYQSLCLSVQRKQMRLQQICLKNLRSLCPPVTIFHFLLHSKITFGGMPFSGKPSSNSRKNFKGCMESINYNGNNITDLAKRKKLEPSNVVRT